MRLPHPTAFALRLRVPSWAQGATLQVNRATVPIGSGANGWATVKRRWQDGDRVALRLRVTSRLIPIDRQHPLRVAVMYGPLLMAQDARYDLPISGDSSEAVLASLVRKPAERITLAWRPRIAPPPGQPVADLTPFYTFGERQPYRTYFVLDRPRLI